MESIGARRPESRSGKVVRLVGWAGGLTVAGIIVGGVLGSQVASHLEGQTEAAQGCLDKADAVSAVRGTPALLNDFSSQEQRACFGVVSSSPDYLRQEAYVDGLRGYVDQSNLMAGAARIGFAVIVGTAGFAAGTWKANV